MNFFRQPTTKDDRFEGYDKGIIKIRKNHRIADHIKGGYYGNPASVYGFIVIPSETTKTFKWQLKCRKYKYPGNWAIGIDSAQNKQYQGCFYFNNASYAYVADGRIYGCGNEQYDKKTSGWNIGQTITLSYNGNTRILSINDEETSKVKIKENVPGYELCIYMYSKGDSVEMVEFECSDNEEEKTNNPNKSSPKIEDLQQMMTKLMGNEQIESLKIENQRQKLELESYKMENESLKQTIKGKESELNETAQESMRQKTVIIDLKKEIAELRNLNSSLMDDEKQSQMTIQRLTAQVAQLKSAAIDIDKFEEWDSQQIITWILSCDNDRFKKYEQDLRKNLNIEQPSGVDLKEVNENDIRRWGITKFADIKALTANIKKLVDNNDDNNVPASASEEGNISGGYYK